MNHFKCKANTSCERRDLPENTPAMCVCAKESMDPAWTPAYLQTLRDYKKQQDANEALDNDGARRVIAMIGKMNEDAA